MKSNNLFYDITHIIFNIISMLLFLPHPLYWWYQTNFIYEISSPIYVDIISIVLYRTSYSLCLYHHSHCTCVSNPHFQWYQNLCIYDFAPTICITSGTLYMVSHPQFMTSRHIIYDITGVVFLSSLQWYLTLHPEYLSPHNHSKDHLWMTVCMISHQLYIWHLMHHR